MSDPSERLKVLQKILTEFTGTFLLVYVGCGATIATNSSGGQLLNFGPVGSALIWGAAMMVLMYSLGHFSDGLFNPAITLSLMIINRVSLLQALSYVVAQISGSMAASLLVAMLNAKGSDDLYNLEEMLTKPTGSIVDAFLVESVGTLFLALVISDVVCDRKKGRATSGLAVGVVVFLNVIIAGPISGASMNPARSLGPAILAGKYTCLWIYLLGPVAGACGGVLLYLFLRCSKTSNVTPGLANPADAGIPV